MAGGNHINLTRSLGDARIPTRSVQGAPSRPPPPKGAPIRQAFGSRPGGGLTANTTRGRSMSRTQIGRPSKILLPIAERDRSDRTRVIVYGSVIDGPEHLSSLSMASSVDRTTEITSMADIDGTLWKASRTSPAISRSYVKT